MESDSEPNFKEILTLLEADPKADKDWTVAQETTEIISGSGIYSVVYS